MDERQRYTAIVQRLDLLLEGQTSVNARLLHEIQSRLDRIEADRHVVIAANSPSGLVRGLRREVEQMRVDMLHRIDVLAEAHAKTLQEIKDKLDRVETRQRQMLDALPGRPPN